MRGTRCGSRRINPKPAYTREDEQSRRAAELLCIHRCVAASLDARSLNSFPPLGTSGHHPMLLSRSFRRHATALRCVHIARSVNAHIVGPATTFLHQTSGTITPPEPTLLAAPVARPVPLWPTHIPPSPFRAFCSVPAMAPPMLPFRVLPRASAPPVPPHSYSRTGQLARTTTGRRYAPDLEQRTYGHTHGHCTSPDVPANTCSQLAPASPA